jgi:fatty-acyl-CoA synthase
MTTPGPVRRATASTVASLFTARARVHPTRVAVEDGARRWTYAELAERTDRLANALAARGVVRGERVAVLSENRTEYLELFLAAAKLGAIVACQSWRLTAGEIAHCLELVDPACAIVSPRHAELLAKVGRATPTIVLGDDYESALAGARPDEPAVFVDPEDPLLVLYTSGTTGLPKGALVSHRAQIARNLVVRAEFGLAAEDAFVAWSPLYHMGATDCAIGALMSGGVVIVVDGFDKSRLAELVATRELGWLLVMPGMIAAFAEELRARGVLARGVKVCGVMADLVPPDQIAEITSLLRAPYANTFGATETGCPPCSSSLLAIGVPPSRLSKTQSPYCEVRLVDANDAEVQDGTPGELCMRGPTLFSGYWRAEDANAQDFRGGWFHMGDVFVRNPDGSLDFVDRVKYLIKTGGENVYPSEIERVLLADPRVADAAVVKRPDPKWGEVPVAYVARKSDDLGAADLFAQCRAALASYKQPKEIVFIAFEAFPRSASGKVQRHELEKLLSSREKETPR